MFGATLGNKTCHSFINNAWFSHLWHPRFGLIMSVVANKEIHAGEEVLVSYSYMMAKSPDWYREQWFDNMQENLEWSEKQIYNWALKELRCSGLHVKILPPNSNSDK